MEHFNKQAGLLEMLKERLSGAKMTGSLGSAFVQEAGNEITRKYGLPLTGRAGVRNPRTLEVMRLEHYLPNYGEDREKRRKGEGKPTVRPKRTPLNKEGSSMDKQAFTDGYMHKAAEERPIPGWLSNAPLVPHPDKKVESVDYGTHDDVPRLRKAIAFRRKAKEQGLDKGLAPHKRGMPLVSSEPHRRKGFIEKLRKSFSGRGK